MEVLLNDMGQLISMIISIGFTFIPLGLVEKQGIVGTQYLCI